VPSCSRPPRYGLAMIERVATLARRPTLTAPARDRVWDLWVGTKKRASGSNKETDKEKEECLRRRLTRKAPYKQQVEERGWEHVRSSPGLLRYMLRIRLEIQAEWARGLSPRAPHGTERKPLDLFGSCHRAKAAAFRCASGSSRRAG
jgi:hypothetical protein